MKIKTNKLVGAALDWTVAKCEGLKLYRNALLGGQIKEGWWVSGYYMDPNNWIPLNLLNFSTDWSQGGPVIERERLCLEIDHAGVWLSYSKQNYGDEPEHMHAGSTPLIAAMRCYVVSKLGDTVDVPDNLE